MVNNVKKQPLYDQLVTLLKEKIEKEYSANTLLPSERELSNMYGLSRTTVRLALQELENLGYIYRRHGKGTFVSNVRESALNLSDTYSFTEQMKALGKVPRTDVLSFQKIEANKYLAEQLNVTLGTSLIEIERLRSADGVEMMLEMSYLPVQFFMTLEEADLKKKAMYDIFREDFRQTIRIAEEEFYAGIAQEKDAKILKILPGAPVLNLIRKTYNTKNEIIEFTTSVARADQFHYKIVHHKD
ncbi:GntR family transcriptional regulator [Enterococcus sp.]|uniref:GntR family transcriptional regulator n=1 Tax=Enterococcus sp. TaxID=35783 RepID=UPI002913A6E1|nr:GntR family transcriptional regulator [Enterococcus sp.]MDU5336014.1 GntR family transcriptional regulator [Enterococcus sp.]